MADNNEKVVEKKENFFKRMIHSKTAQKVALIGTTIVSIAETGFLIWAYFDAKSEASVQVAPNEEFKELEVKTVPHEEIVKS